MLDSQLDATSARAKWRVVSKSAAIIHKSALPSQPPGGGYIKWITLPNFHQCEASKESSGRESLKSVEPRTWALLSSDVLARVPQKALASDPGCIGSE